MTADVAVIGGGPAGASAALAALREDPTLDVVILDRADFPRDKSCGDGIAPHALDLLAAVGATGLTTGFAPVRRLHLRRGPIEARRDMARAAWVVPRAVFDHRLVEAAQAAGARLVRHRVRTVEHASDGVVVDREVRARLVVAADGAHSVVRRVLGRPSGSTALALRGYAPTPASRVGAQIIVFGTTHSPSYAWSFDRGDGLANVGYGELLTDRAGPTRAQLLERLEDLLPAATAGSSDWRGHPLPFSGWRAPSAGHGRVLLVGDAAGLVNPLTGEGIYYAVATGIHAGRAAAASLAADGGRSALVRYRTASRGRPDRHRRHTAAAAILGRSGLVLDAGVAAAAADQRVFDDLTELGLAEGHISPTLVRGMVAATAARLTRRPSRTAPPQEEPA